MDIAIRFRPYLDKIEPEYANEIFVSILFHNLLNNTKVPSGRIGKEFGEYVQSLIDKESENHIINLSEAAKRLEDAGAPNDLLELFKNLLS